MYKQEKRHWEDLQMPSTADMRSRDLNIVCSARKFVDIAQRISSAQKLFIENLGFAGLLCMQHMNIHRKLCMWIADQYDPTNKTVHINGKKLSITMWDVKCIMDLPDKGEEITCIPDNVEYAMFKLYAGDGKASISLESLEEAILGSKFADDHFIRRFILLLIGHVLCPTTNRYVSAAYLGLLNKVEDISKINWASLTLWFLHDSLTAYKNGQKHLQGNLILLQVWYWEHCQVDQDAHMYTKRKYPLILNWNLAIYRQRDAIEGKTGYGRSIIVEELPPPDNEDRTSKPQFYNLDQSDDNEVEVHVHQGNESCKNYGGHIMKLCDIVEKLVKRIEQLERGNMQILQEIKEMKSSMNTNAKSESSKLEEEDGKINANSDVDTKIQDNIENDEETEDDVQELMGDINYPSPPIARRIRGPNGRMPTSTYGTSNHYVYYGLPNKRKTSPKKRNVTSKCGGGMLSLLEKTTIDYIKNSCKEKKMATLNSIHIQREAMLCLTLPDSAPQTKRWLGDEQIMDGYIRLIKHRYPSTRTRDGCKPYFESTIDCQLLNSAGEFGLRSNSRKIGSALKRGEKYLQHDLIFLPLNHMRVHWYLVVINTRKEEIQVLDSMAVSKYDNRTVLINTIKGVQIYVDLAISNGTAIARWGSLLLTSWPIRVMDIPQQNDSSSCGLFVLKFMEYWDGTSLANIVTMDNIHIFRKKISLGINTFQVE